jgi:hypothetical protein
MKSWFGVEPALGIIVLLVSLPIVGALAYITVNGAIEHPYWFILFWALYAAGLILRHVLERLEREFSARAKRAIWLVIIIGFLGWSFMPVFRLWFVDGRPGPALAMLGIMIGWYILLQIGGRRAAKTDYHHK